MKLELLEGQLYPARKSKDKEQYVLASKKELLLQLKSLQADAFINAHNPFHDPVFYKDYNALSIAIKIIEQEVKE